MLRILSVALLAAVTWLTAHINGPSDVRLVASVDTVDVSPNLDTLVVRTPLILTARTVDSVGRTKNVPVTWIIRDSSLFKSIRTTGAYNTHFKATAKSDTGRTYVVATAGSKKDSALAIVRDTVCSETALGSINLYPDSSTAHRTDTLGAVATPRNACGHLLGGVNLTWASSDSTKVTITSVDSLVGKMIVLDSSGTIYIKAISGSKRDSVKVKPKHAP